MTSKISNEQSLDIPKIIKEIKTTKCNHETTNLIGKALETGKIDCQFEIEEVHEGF
jgi:hypothetical protein